MKRKLTFKMVNKLLSKNEAETFEEIYEDYIERYAKFIEGRPNLEQLLKQSIKYWLKIEEIWEWLETSKMSVTNMKEYRQWLKTLDGLVHTWRLLLTSMAMTFTGQPYVPVEDRKVLKPEEVDEMSRKMDELTTKARRKLAEHKKKERRNKGGARKKEHGVPIEYASKAKKKA